jgi:hypothetical protein
MAFWSWLTSRNGARRVIGWNITIDISAGLDLDVPQWSPPVIGGSTGLIPVYWDGLPLPQWSPPLNGGSTPNCAWVANVAQMPQWSPPLTAGAQIGAAPHVWDLPQATMKPAADWREHVHLFDGPGSPMPPCSRR